MSSRGEVVQKSGIMVGQAFLPVRKSKKPIESQQTRMSVPPFGDFLDSLDVAVSLFTSRKLESCEENRGPSATVNNHAIDEIRRAFWLLTLARWPRFPGESVCDTECDCRRGTYVVIPSAKGGKTTPISLVH
jgi:hypothetical protein